MPRLLPSSRAGFGFRLSPIDVVCAALAPPLALFLRDAQVLTLSVPTAILYCILSSVFTLIAFLAFRVGHGLTRYFSVHDAVSIISAVIAAGLTTTGVFFIFTRLEGIPRSIAIIQALILAAGMLIARAILALRDRDDQRHEPGHHAAVEHIIMIGSSRLTALYIKMLQAHAPAQRQVIAVLDGNQKLRGRTVCGVPIVGVPDHLVAVIKEFEVHGVRTDRVIVGGYQTLLSEAVLEGVVEICAEREIVLGFVPKLLGLDPLPTTRPIGSSALVPAAVRPAFGLSKYFRYKRAVDFVFALVAITVLSPVFLIASALVLLDLGAPVVFWQKRIGRNGRGFLVYKFRTLHAPFDRDGQPNPNGDYRSWIGNSLRRTRIDELPQLFNVLVGEMSLIGPRPLLPQDQPANCNLRLLVRPGITGWAQINGGNLITTEEKGALDDWYIRNASLWLDLRTALFTLIFLFTGERRFEQAVRDANALRMANGQSKTSVERKRFEPREPRAAPGQRSVKLSMSARANTGEASI
jgi:lipopolysaccharide/colanic/teichoic acid biosynthesis glycosyltransferase